MKTNSSLTVTSAVKKIRHSERVTMVEKNMTLALSEGLVFELSQLCREVGELLHRGLQTFCTGTAILLEELGEDFSDVA